MTKFNNPFESFFTNNQSVPNLPNEIKGFEAGEYQVRVTFINYKGETVTRSLDFPIRLSEQTPQEILEKKAVGEANFIGLHNLGMDVYIKNYPNGHPVTIELFKNGEETPAHTFLQKFDGSGRPVK